MTNQTMSLALAFAVAVGATGVLMAVAVQVLDGTGVAGPWLLPVVAGLTQCGVLWLGRRYILSPAITNATPRAAAVIITAVTLTMAVVAVVAWTVRAWLGPPPAALLIALWFALLWFVLLRYQSVSGFRMPGRKPL